jgi:RHS repeat-associated protein
MEANGQIRTVNNLWCGETLCAQTNEQGQITHRYFGQGEWHNDQAYFYAQDQIGSVTAMIDTQGKIAGTALYSPYGKLLQSQGVQANIAYAGLYHHKESGLYLATYRGYNPFTARWLSRDPIEENGGLNLYEYVGGNPATHTDTNGENPLLVIGIGAAVGGLASGITTYAVTGNIKEAVDSAAYGAIGGAAAVGSFLVAPATLAGTAAAVVFDTAINAAGYMTSVADVLKNDTECNK